MEIHRFGKDKRNAIKNDLPALQKMCGYFEPLQEWMETQIREASDIFYAVNGKEVLGYLIANNEGTHLQIELICVGETGRAMKGIGTSLMKEAERVAKAYGLPQVRLQSQFKAESFYKKLNYKEVSRNEYGVNFHKSL